MAAPEVGAQTARVMPLGDSITRGSNDINFPFGDIPGGYRKKLQELLTAGNFAFDFVGLRNDNSAPGIDPDHNGVNGHRADQHLSNIGNLLAADPDNVLMMLGTNDIIQSIPPATAAGNLNNLILQFANHDPTCRIYVATILPITEVRNNISAEVHNANANTYNSLVRDLVQQHITAGRNVTLVDMNALVVLDDPDPAKDFFQPGDGLHPGQAGYDQLGELWFTAITAGGNLVDPPPVGLPAAPSGLGFQVTSSTRINLTWVDNATNETSYEIRRRIGAMGDWETVANLPANTTSAIVTGLNTQSTIYGFSVRAVNGAGTSAWSPSVEAIPISGEKANQKPATATASTSGLTPEKAVDGLTSTRWASANLGPHHWTVDLGAEFPINRVELVTPPNIDVAAQRNNFEVQASNDPSFAPSAYVVLGAQGSTPVPQGGTFVADLANPQSYRYVRMAKTDNQSFAIALVRVFANQVFTIPATPLALTAAAVGDKHVRLSWEVPSNNETGFKLERKAGTEGTYTQVATIGAGETRYMDSGLGPSENYIYRLRAWNEVGDSEFGNEASVTTESMTAYDLWVSAYPEFLALPMADRLPDADPNGDGTINLLSYAMGMNPLESGSLPFMDTSSGAPVGVFKFRRSKVAPDVTYEVLIAEDLVTSTWDVLDLAPALVTNAVGEPNVEIVAVPLPTGAGITKQFVRLKVVQTPAP